MADHPFLSSGLAGSCKSARQGLGFPASDADAEGTPRPYLPPDIVRLVDARARAMERAELLLAMNGGDRGRTLCDAASAGGLLDTRFLLAAGAHAGAFHGEALKQACAGGHIRVAEALLEGAGGMLITRHLNSALWRAARAGRSACCELLLERGADIHDGEDLALRAAALHGQLETVAFLLDRGADAWSEQALENAANGHHDAIVALMLEGRR